MLVLCRVPCFQASSQPKPQQLYFLLTSQRKLGPRGFAKIPSWESPTSGWLQHPSSRPITTSQGSRDSDGAAFEPGVGVDFPEKWNGKQLGNNSAVLL